MSRAPADPDVWGWVLDRFKPVHDAHLHRIAPGGFIVPHIDRGPWRERWHVPICTSGSWIGGRQPAAGQPFQIIHWEPHDVWNPADQARVHLVIDRDIPIDRPSAPFRVFPVPDRWMFLIRQAKEA